jgi:hypothetical protein
VATTAWPGLNPVRLITQVGMIQLVGGRDGEPPLQPVPPRWTRNLSSPVSIFRNQPPFQLQNSAEKLSGDGAVDTSR